MIAWVLAVITGLPVFYADRAPALEQAKAVQSKALAVNIANVCSRPFGGRTYRECVAVMAMISYSESANSLEVHEGRCLPHQCDPRRLRNGTIEFTSRSTFQMKRNSLDDESWARMVGVENTAYQVREAFRRMASGHAFCRRSAPWPSSVIRGYAGSAQCAKPIRGEAARVRVYLELVNR